MCPNLDVIESVLRTRQTNDTTKDCTTCSAMPCQALAGSQAHAISLSNGAEILREFQKKTSWMAHGIEISSERVIRLTGMLWPFDFNAWFTDELILRLLSSLVLVWGCDYWLVPLVPDRKLGVPRT